MVIRTPATKESARISKKRKCVIDDMTVLPNEYVMVYCPFPCVKRSVVEVFLFCLFVEI